MKMHGLTISANLIEKVLISTLLGGLIGFGFEYLTGNKYAVLICAMGAGVAAVGRLRRQQSKLRQDNNS